MQMLETVIVAAAVLWAVGYVARAIAYTLKGRVSPCGSCGNGTCSSKRQLVTLVALDPSFSNAPRKSRLDTKPLA